MIPNPNEGRRESLQLTGVVLKTGLLSRPFGCGAGVSPTGPRAAGFALHIKVVVVSEGLALWRPVKDSKSFNTWKRSVLSSCVFKLQKFKGLLR